LAKIYLLAIIWGFEVWQFPTSGKENTSRIATFGSTQRVSSVLDSTELSLG